jgi:serine/threonine protein kinase
MDGEARVAEEPSGQPDGLLVRLGPGSLVAGYRLERRIGAGGMAVVFRAHEERLGRMVALKILPPMLSGDREFRGRFIRESRLATAVDDPHILPIYGAGEADGVLFIAMRLVTGGDLSSVIRREGPLAPGRAMSFIAPVAAALDAAHDAGLVHRDVKPANILVDIRPGRPEHVYLSDFGLSKSAMSVTGLTGTGRFMEHPTTARRSRSLASR